ncbi:MAG: hypothetical protein AB1815_02410 [Bacillota bacterium]
MSRRRRNPARQRGSRISFNRVPGNACNSQRSRAVAMALVEQT